MLFNSNQGLCHAWQPTDHQVEARYDLICLWVDFNLALCIFILNICHLSLPTGSHLNVSSTNFGKRKKKNMDCDSMGVCQAFPGVTLQMTGLMLRLLVPIPTSFFSQD